MKDECELCSKKILFCYFEHYSNYNFLSFILDFNISR